MFKKISLTLVLALSLSATPSKASPATPLENVVTGLKLSKEIIELMAPLVVGGVKKTVKLSKRVIGHFKRKHKKDKDLYISPLRIAALQKDEEREERLAKLQAKFHRTESFDESLFK